MSLRDLRTLPEGYVFQADVCIIGSGPAGMTLARELASLDEKVVLLESGGRVVDPWLDSLNEIESVGEQRVMDQTLVRNRILGGTSATWSGRVATFDRMDFEERPWVRGSGWPIERSSLSQYFRRTGPHLGIDVADNSVAPPERLAQRCRSGIDSELLDDYFWSYSRDKAGSRGFVRLGARALADEVPGVTGLINATVRHVNTQPCASRVSGVEVVGLDGLPRIIEARYVAVCAGGIENPRLLLASSREVRGGLGNQHDNVGRYLADHPRGPVATFDSKDHQVVQRHFSNRYVRLTNDILTLSVGFALSPPVQEREGLLNCSMWVDGTQAGDDPLGALASMVRRRRISTQDLGSVLRGVPLLATGLKDVAVERHGPVRRFDDIVLQVMVEQEPDRNSRVSLAERTDAFGVPLARIDWRVGELEVRTVRRALEIFADEMERHGIPRPQALDMMSAGRRFHLPDVAHPSGTTRMARDPRNGVVGPDCEVHGVAGLFVAGSSVFPTNGHANPTQMIVALSIRLADELKARLRSDRAPRNPSAPRVETQSKVVRPTQVTADGERRLEERPTVLVTGATGKIGQALTPMLNQRGFKVRGLTSRMREAGDDLIDWRVRDLRRSDFDFSEEVTGAHAVVHLGAELRYEPDMTVTNVEATAALSAAAAAAGVRTLCFASSVSVYGSARVAESLEDGDVLTADTDVESEYWGNRELRAYGRSKVLGEEMVAAKASGVECVIFRPSVVVDEQDVMSVVRWGMLRRTLLARRCTHHIYVNDVAAAITWALERSLRRADPSGGVTVYNLSDDGAGTYEEFFDHARAAGLAIPRGVAPRLAKIVDWGKDYVRYGGLLPIRRPLGYMRFPSSKLRAEGFELPHGMPTVRATVFDRLLDAET